MKKSLIIISLLFFTYAVCGQNLDNLLNNSRLSSTAAISVTIGGDFPVTGSFPAYISERVDQFITRLYLEARERSLQTTNEPKIISEIEEKLNNYSLRGIVLRRSNGEEIKVDLQRFRITGDFKYNPYLKNDDVIIFPANDIERNFFTVSGAVNKPDVFFYIDGDSLNDALELAMGVSEAYEKAYKVTISRLNYQGNNLSVDTVDVSQNVRINRGDHIKVIASDNLRKNYYVLVLGEVKNPGSYPITKNDTKLYEIINAAGGLTEQASVSRAKLYSGKSLALYLEEEYNIKLADQTDFNDPVLRSAIINLEAALMYRMSNVYPDDTTYFFLENQLRVLTEGSSLDFSKIDDPNSDISKYILKDRDVIVIPAVKKAVYVFGQVANPGYVPITTGKDYSYYIKEAGGIGEFARMDDIMVIKGGSRRWISPVDDEVFIEDGDYIYVPKERLRTFRSYAAEYAVYVQMLASVATVILLFITAFK